MINYRNLSDSYFKLILVIILSLSLILLYGCQTQEKIDTDITKITLWHGINPPENRDVFNDLVAQFNQEHLDIEVAALYIGQPDAQLPKIFAATVSGASPNMLWFVPQLTGELVNLGALLPLENWLNNSPIKSQIDPAMFDSMELDGHIFSIPFATNNAAIFYRPSLFKAAGITTTPKTWDEFKVAAKKLTKDTNNDGRIDQYGVFLSLGKGEWTVFVWLPFIYSAGGDLLVDNEPNLVNEGTINALQLAADLVSENVALLSAPERGYEMDNFLSGKAAMQVTGPWTLGQLSQTDIDYGVFPFPVLKNPSAVLGGENLFVFKSNSKKEEACYQFLEYVLSEKFQTIWALKTGYLPINLRSQQSKAYQQFLQENPVLQVFLDQMQWTKSRPIIAKYTRVSENLGRAIEATLLQKQTPEEALRNSQQRLDLIFND